MPLSSLFKPARAPSPPPPNSHEQRTTPARILSREFPPLAPPGAASPTDVLDVLGQPQLADPTEPLVHAPPSPQLMLIPQRDAATANTQHDEAAAQLLRMYRQREADWVRREVIYRTREAWLCQRLREAEEQLRWWCAQYNDDDDNGADCVCVSPDRSLSASEYVSDEGSAAVAPPPVYPSSHCYGWPPPATLVAADLPPSFHYAYDGYYGWSLRRNMDAADWYARQYARWQHMQRRQRRLHKPAARSLMV